MTCCPHPGQSQRSAGDRLRPAVSVCREYRAEPQQRCRPGLGTFAAGQADHPGDVSIARDAAGGGDGIRLLPPARAAAVGRTSS